MDVARINCAHDDAAAWVAMASSVRQAARRAGRPVRVLMDLGGPKLRTGPIGGGAAVVKLKPRRDDFGRVTAPARLGLRPQGSSASIAAFRPRLGVDAAWLASLEVGRSHRSDRCRAAQSGSLRWSSARRRRARRMPRAPPTLSTGPRLRLRRRRRRAHRNRALRTAGRRTGGCSCSAATRCICCATGMGHGRAAAEAPPARRPASIACTLPEALAQVRKGERIWFDDGRIGGVVRRQGARRRRGRDHARARRRRAAARRQGHQPARHPARPAGADRQGHRGPRGRGAACADLVGLSFAQSAGDVRALRAAPRCALARQHLGLILKIETRRGFEHLPEMLLAAMAVPVGGVMIARGDLAVECGYERMAEVQEEILWACEAAHMPVVWATQVLETLAKTGLPSRAEITDAAMGERAECVMLNKGPHILDAMRTLDDILRRMQAHQSKKRPLLRALKAWAAPLESEATVAPKRRAPDQRGARDPKPSRPRRHPVR